MRNSQVELTPTWVSLCHTGAPAVMEPPGGAFIAAKIVDNRVGVRSFRKVLF